MPNLLSDIIIFSERRKKTTLHCSRRAFHWEFNLGGGGGGGNFMSQDGWEKAPRMNRGLGPNAGKQVLKSSKQGKKQNNIQKRDTTNGNSWCPEHKKPNILGKTVAVTGTESNLYTCAWNILTRKGGAWGWNIKTVTMGNSWGCAQWQVCGMKWKWVQEEGRWRPLVVRERNAGLDSWHFKLNKDLTSFQTESFCTTKGWWGSLNLKKTFKTSTNVLSSALSEQS